MSEISVKARIVKDGKTYEKVVTPRDTTIWSPQSKAEHPVTLQGTILARYDFRAGSLENQPALMVQDAEGRMWSIILGTSLWAQLSEATEGESVFVTYETTVPLSGGKKFHRFSAYLEVPA